MDLWQPFYDHEGRQARKACKLMMEEYKAGKNLTNPETFLLLDFLLCEIIHFPY